MHKTNLKSKFSIAIPFFLACFATNQAQFSCLSCILFYENVTNENQCFASIVKPVADHNLLAKGVFPFLADDKESNSSSGGDAKSKPSSSSTTAAASNNSNNSSAKNVNSNESTSTDKANSTSKTSTPSTSANNDQAVTNSAKSIESASDQGKSSPATKANNCDALSDVINSCIDTSGIKLEIKDDPDAPKVTKSVNNIQPALGGSLLPPHAANAKHPVSISKISFVYFMLGEF